MKKTFHFLFAVALSLAVLGLSQAHAQQAAISASSNACNSTTEGAIRYNNTSNLLEFCDGSSWASIAPAAGINACYVITPRCTTCSSTIGFAGLVFATDSCASGFTEEATYSCVATSGQSDRDSGFQPFNAVAVNSTCRVCCQ